MYRSTKGRGIASQRDPRFPIVMSMVFLEYPETLAPGRTRERIGMKALAGIGRLLRMRTD